MVYTHGPNISKWNLSLNVTYGFYETLHTAIHSTYLCVRRLMSEKISQKSKFHQKIIARPWFALLYRMINNAKRCGFLLLPFKWSKSCISLLHFIWVEMPFCAFILSYFMMGFARRLHNTQYTLFMALCILEELLSFEMNVNACALVHTQNHCPIIRSTVRAVNILYKYSKLISFSACSSTLHSFCFRSDF